MQYVFRHYVESKEYIAGRLGDFRPEILLILGSGLGFMADEVENPVYVDYSEIPHFKRSTAPDHVGRFVFGTLCGRKIAVMQGRLHCYEGYDMAEVSYPVRVMKLLGVSSMIVTNAAGCVNVDWEVGDLMLISDQIRLTRFGPLAGPNIEEFGPRFPDMTDAYTKEYRLIAREEALKLGITLREGVYMFFAGPNFETPAEIRAARVLGANAVGMSTVPEVTVAAQCEMKVLGFSVMTNMAAGVLPEKLSGAEISAAAEAASERFSALIRACIPKLD